MLPKVLVNALIILISVAWAANVVAGLVYPERHDPSLNAIFAAVVGAVFAFGKERHGGWRRRLARLLDDENQDDEHPHHHDHREGDADE